MPKATTQNPRASLVESIPVGLESLRGTLGVQYTEDVLVRLTQAAQSTIDLTAMYWALLPDPKSVDEQGFTDKQFQQMGADHGRALYEALCDAARRDGGSGSHHHRQRKIRASCRYRKQPFASWSRNRIWRLSGSLPQVL